MPVIRVPSPDPDWPDFELLTSHARATFLLESEEEPTLSASSLVGHIASIDYLYKLLTIISPIHMYRGRLSLFDEVSRLRSAAGMLAASHALQSRFPREARLVVRSVRVESPALVTFEGIADSLKAITSIVDPISWLERLEKLRHDKVTNKLEERRLRLTALREGLVTLEEITKRTKLLPQLIEQTELDTHLAETLATEIESEIVETVGGLVSADIKVKPIEFALTKSDG